MNFITPKKDMSWNGIKFDLTTLLRKACLGFQHVNQESQEIIALLLAHHAIYPREQRLRDQPKKRTVVDMENRVAG